MKSITAKKKNPKNKVVKRAGDTAEQVFQRLVEGIVSGHLTAGEPLREARVAEAWKVSRTPVREAVRRAASFGLLELRANRRPLIRKLTSDDVDKLLAVRSALELMAFDLAAKSIVDSLVIARLQKQAETLAATKPGALWTRRALALDDTLHQLWIGSCGNPWLQLALGSLWSFIRILQRFVTNDPALGRLAYDEHVAILQALQAGDIRQARKNLKHHIHSAAQALRERLKSTE